ncbi:unnamed protein product, partial [Didymodactylos carnosus]
MSDVLHAPADILFYKNQKFFDYVRNITSDIVVDILQLQEINSAQILLCVENALDILYLDCDELAHLKKRVGFTLNNGDYIIRPGVRESFDFLINSLKLKVNEDKHVIQSNDNTGNGALLEQIVDAHNNEGNTFMKAFIENIVNNLKRSKNNYQYNEYVKRFALSLYILAGRNAYEFVRINLPGAIPSIATIESYMKCTNVQITECEFRFKSLKHHLNRIDSRHGFCAEDCTSVVKKISYDRISNSFIGFCTPLNNGVPQPVYFQTDNFHMLENWFKIAEKSSLLNLHMIQPITTDLSQSAPFILAAYGTNNKVISTGIIRRWLYIYNECSKESIRIIGFSTDCDAKYLKSMRLVSRFFANLPNIPITDNNDDNLFEIHVPAKWSSWFFLQPKQILLFMQDPIHLCTKLRNRILSAKATLLIGTQQVNIKHLEDLIDNSSKLDHNLVKSDIFPKDKQNFTSCLKISSKDVLSMLTENSNTTATRFYLTIIHLTILAYIDKTTSVSDRIYFAWITVFMCRF